MTGAEFKITDAIDPEIFKKLKEISDKIRTATSDYSNFTQELAKKVTVNPGNLSELEAKAKSYMSILTSIHAGQNKLADLQEQQMKIFGEISKKLDQISTPLNRMSDSMASFTSNVNAANSELDKSAASTQKAAQGMQNASKQVSMASNDYNDIIKSIEAYDVQINELYKTLSKNKAETKSVKRDISDLSIKYKAGRVDIEEYAAEMARLERRQTELSEENKKYNTLLRTHARVMVSAQGSYDEMSAAVLELERRYKSIEKTERQGAVGKDLLDNINKLKDELKSIDASMGNYQRNVGNYSSAFEGLEDKVKDLLGLNNTFAESIIKLGEGGGGNFFNNLSAGASAFGRTLTGLLANPAFLVIAGIAGAGAVFKFWYDYNKGIQEATKLTSQFTGATGDELKQNRNEVQALADMYGKDFKETLIAINSVSKQFGISFDEAFRHIRDGFLSGADANGEFLDNLKEYPAYFKEAGISASEFIAITTQANKQGIFSDKGIDVIKEGNIRIREMTKATSAALEGIGISSWKVQEELQNGSKTTFDIMQEVSRKLAELPESSSAVGTALADIFGGPGEDAGLQYIKTLKDIDTNLDTVREKAGRLAELEAQQLESQLELEHTLSSLFDATGGAFEEMTTKAKIFVNEGIVYIITRTVELINWVIDLYNRSSGLRAVAQGIGEAFNVSFTIIGEILGVLISNIKVLAKGLKGLLMLDFDAVEQAWKEGVQRSVDAVSNVISGAKDSWNNIISSTQKQIDPIKIPLEVASVAGSGNERKITSGGNRKLTDEEKKAMEESRKEELRIEKEYENSKLELMEEGLEKELAKIRSNYTQRIAAVKGNSEKENETRLNLAEKMRQELAGKEIDFYLNQEKKKTELALASVKKNSEEELSLRLRMNDLEYEAEVNALNGNYENLNAIIAKFERERADIEEQFASARIKRIQENAVLESTYRTADFKKELDDIELLHAKGLMNDEEYNRRKLEISSKYAVEQAQASLHLINEQLSVNLPEDETLKLKQKQAEAEIALAKAVRDAEIEAAKQAAAEQKKKLDQLAGNIQMVGDVLNALSDLGSAIFDGKIQKIEEEQESNEAAGEAEIARIEALEERGAITTEEAEARKRAAEDKTAKKNEELEKKKAALQTKQAKFEKANSIAQSMINTATGIVKTIASVGFPAAIPLIAAVSAIGALQLAAIIATPIPKYAKGTLDHKGGPAIVGDGGVAETILTDKGAYLTPSVPTLVDIPKGAQVIPFAVDMERMKASANDLSGLMSYREENGLPPISIVNDYSELEREIKFLRKGQQMGFSRLAKAIKDNNYQHFSKSV